jgi:hypothetical protein
MTGKEDGADDNDADDVEDDDLDSDSEDLGPIPARASASDFRLGDTHIDLQASALKDMLSTIPVAGTPAPQSFVAAPTDLVSEKPSWAWYTVDTESMVENSRTSYQPQLPARCTTEQIKLFALRFSCLSTPLHTLFIVNSIFAGHRG